MAEHIISSEGITARDRQHREDMEAASHALLCAIVRELDGMGVRRVR